MYPGNFSKPFSRGDLYTVRLMKIVYSIAASFCKEYFFMRCHITIAGIVLVLSFMFMNHDAHAYFGALLEPPDGQLYHGAQAEVRPAKHIRKLGVDWTGIEEYTATTGKRPKLIMHYISLDPLAFYLLRCRVQEITGNEYGYIPQIGLDFYTYFRTFNIHNPSDITEAIAKGEYDERIRKLARMFIAMNSPVFLRPGYEFGGKGQGRYASKTCWIAAWKRIHDIFRHEGASQVAFVWNTLDARDYMDYYPGDEYVDWWGINIFVNNAADDPFINDFIKHASKHRKPVMIGESTPRYAGSAGGNKSIDDWYEPYFRLIRKYGHIKAFCYINSSWTDFPGGSFRHDCRVQMNEVVLDYYKKMISTPGIIHCGRK